MAYTTIKKPSDYFNTVLYTGDGASSKTVSGVGFQPDFTWIKNRDSGTAEHVLGNIIQGYGDSGTTLKSNSEGVEALNSSTQRLINPGATSDGFTVGNSSYTNGSGNGIVAWNWLASNTTAANTDGSITSTVSANTTSGFSIVNYAGTGATGTIGHGLNSAPKMIIVKNRDNATAWQVYHASLGATKYLKLDATDAEATNTNRWNDTEPTSSVFTVSTGSGINGNVGSDYIAYCFAEKQGFSKFGSYTGNGSTDGTFVYTGFKPAFVIIKVYSTTNSWDMYDSARNPFNDVDLRLYADLTNADNSDPSIDFVSNGFKLRDTLGANNASGASYIYMAFAEEPLVGDNPATAR